MKKKNKGVSFLIVAALLLTGCPDLNKNGASPALAGSTQTDIAFSGNKLEITFDKELKSKVDVGQITVTLDNSVIPSTDYELKVSGTKLVITFKTNPSTGQKYKVSLKAGAVTGKDGGTFKKKDSVEIPFVVPPAYTKGSITQNNNKIELRFSKALATMANVSPNPTHIKVTRTRSEGASETLTISTDYTLGISGSKLVIILIKPPIAGVYTVALRASAVKSADGGLSMAVSPEPTIEILSSNELSRQLLVAAYLNNAKEVATLIAAGANVNVKNDDGDTPLYLAAKQSLFSVNQVNKLKIVQALIAAGADVKTKDKDGKTPVYWAAGKGHTATVQALIDAKADVNAKSNDYGYTPLRWAARKGYTDIVKILIDADADLEVKDKFSHTPLHLAAREGHTDIVKILIDADADLNAKDRFKKTPLKLAKSRRHTDIVKLLEAAGATE